jgi:succinyl-CoA synthetase beta subunit
MIVKRIFMRLFEYEAKRVFKENRISVPAGEVVESSKGAEDIAEKLGKSVVLKIQIPVGGRGKAGGIKVAETPKEAGEIASKLLGKEFSDHKVEKLLVEEKLDIAKELYLGITNDDAARKPIVMLSSGGGMEIEEIAEKYPEKLASMRVDVRRGLQPYQARGLAKRAGVESPLISSVGGALWRLYGVYRKHDAELTEINPLIITKDGKAIAGDARLNVDDNSLYRHAELKAEGVKRLNERERIAREKGFGYVEIDERGEIACIANGAGLGMTSFDYITESGATLACFLDVGGRFYDIAGDAIKLVLGLPNLKTVLIHSYGGVTRADRLAESACKALKELKPKIPIMIELSGTGEEGAVETMKREAPELRKLRVKFEWLNHTTVGDEDENARKGGVDTIEYPVKKVVEWAGRKYKRNPPEWLPGRPKWEAKTRANMKKMLVERPEERYRRLAGYE